MQRIWVRTRSGAEFLIVMDEAKVAGFAATWSKPLDSTEVVALLGDDDTLRFVRYRDIEVISYPTEADT